MKNYLYGVAVVALSGMTAHAQNEIDILRYSQQNYTGTALSLGMAGAGGAMGGDFSLLSLNPAGIGVYRSSEITVTPALRINKATTTYYQNAASDNKTAASLNNVGLIFTYAPKGKRYENASWKSISFGIGYNRVADYNQNIYLEGNNDQSSIAEIFAHDAQQYGVGANGNPPLGYLGYEGYLLNDQLQSVVPYWDGLMQRKNISNKGRTGEYLFSLGGNYKEKLLLGMSVGLQDYSFTRSSVYSEDDLSGNTNNDFAYLDYYEDYSAEGFGVNVKLGAIYVVNDLLKIGAAVHTPTWATFSDISRYALVANTENFAAAATGNPEVTADPNLDYSFSYGLRTPWSATVNASLMIGKFGMINADYQIVGYNSMHYTMRNAKDYADAVNASIKNTFVPGHVIRIGAEGRAGNFMGRAGFAYYTNPFKDAGLFKGDRMDIAVGAGLRWNAFFLDLGYMYSMAKASDYAYPYLVSGVPAGIADTRFNNSTLALTLGFKM